MADGSGSCATYDWLTCDVIELTVPAAERHARLVRLVAAASARRCGFGIDRIDDVKTVVDEAFMLATSVCAKGAPIGIRFAPKGPMLEVRMSGLGVGGPEVDLGEDSRVQRYGLYILGFLADEVRFVPRDGQLELYILISQGISEGIPQGISQGSSSS